MRHGKVKQRAQVHTARTWLTAILPGPQEGRIHCRQLQRGMEMAKGRSRSIHWEPGSAGQEYRYVREMRIGMGLERRAESRRFHEESIDKTWDKPIPSLRETQMFRGPLTEMEKLRKAPSMGQMMGSV